MWEAAMSAVTVMSSASGSSAFTSAGGMEAAAPRALRIPPLRVCGGAERA